MTDDQIIKVVQAHKDGKTIQCRKKDDPDCAVWGHDPWKNCFPNWDFYRADFRVRPEPREFWINVYPRSSFYAYCTEHQANNMANSGREALVRVREVIE